jgi:putative ABC transport system permease protein
MADLRAQSATLEELTLSRFQSVNLTGAGEPEQLEGARVSPNLFLLLGVTPLIGRTLEAADDARAALPVVVLSHALWRRHFGGDSAVLGRNIMLNGRAQTVIGVMPAGFAYPSVECSYWVPLHLDPANDGRGDHFFEAVGRLRRVASVEQARAEVQSLGRALARTWPKEAGGWDLDALGLADHVVRGGVRPALITLFAAVGVVLVLACANVANLLLARGLERRQEMALRAAIGASRGRLARLLLAESLLLAAAGGALGLILAQASLQGLLALYPPGLPRASEIRLDAPVLLFAAALSLVTALLTGFAPALRLSRADLHVILKPGPRSQTPRAARLRGGLVISQIALALVLLVCSGLLIRSLLRRTQVEGFDPSDILLVEVRDVPEARLSLILDRIRALPGVAAAGSTSSPAYTHMMSVHVWTNQAGREDEFAPAFEVVTPGYFEAMGIPLRRGRFLERRDSKGAPGAVVIDEATARRCFPGQDPVGRTLRFAGGQTPWTVVGVVAGVDLGHHGGPWNRLYAPAAQFDIDTDILAIRAAAPRRTAPAIRGLIRSMEPDTPILRVESAGDDIRGLVASPRFYTLLLGTFAAIALALAALGVYGVVSCGVRARTHEIGIRTALGATASDVVGSMMRQGAAVVVLGVVLGEAAAFAAARLLSVTGLLYQVRPADPLTFALVPCVLLAVALVACYLPARRAAQVDPVAALRTE